MKQTLYACLFSAALIAGGPVAATAQQPGVPAAQDEFVPLRDLPPAEQLPAAPLVIASYALIWAGTFGYLWFIWRRLGSVEREIATLRREIDRRPAANP